MQAAFVLLGHWFEMRARGGPNATQPEPLTVEGPEIRIKPVRTRRLVAVVVLDEPREDHHGLTEAQADGLACVVCSSCTPFPISRRTPTSVAWFCCGRPAVCPRCGGPAATCRIPLCRDWERIVGPISAVDNESE